MLGIRILSLFLFLVLSITLGLLGWLGVGLFLGLRIGLGLLGSVSVK